MMYENKKSNLFKIAVLHKPLAVCVDTAETSLHSQNLQAQQRWHIDKELLRRY